MNIVEIKEQDDWPEGLSDGLILPCAICYTLPMFDYIVDDDIWNKLVLKKHKRDVICLCCLDVIGHELGIDISGYLQEVQFVGMDKTIILKPEIVYKYSKKN